MRVLNIVWQYGEPEGGGTRVFETEHLFGYDVIFVTGEHDNPIPIAHISSNRQMSAAERISARMCCIWRDSQRFDISASHLQRLAESLAD